VASSLYPVTVFVTSSPCDEFTVSHSSKQFRVLINFVVHLQNVSVSSGMRAGDLEKLKIILELVPDVKYICLDVANGYSEHFVEFVKQVRQEFPQHTIMVSMFLFYSYICLLFTIFLYCFDIISLIVVTVL